MQLKENENEEEMESSSNGIQDHTGPSRSLYGLLVLL